jgi:hypothetical protein
MAFTTFGLLPGQRFLKVLNMTSQQEGDLSSKITWFLLAQTKQQRWTARLIGQRLSFTQDSKQ